MKNQTAAALQRARMAVTGATLKSRAVLELPIARLDFVAGERAEAVHPEFFAAETPHHRSVDDGAAQLGEVDVAARGIDPASRQVADESAGETVARAGGIEHVVQQVA